VRGGSIAEVITVFLGSYLVGWLLLDDVIQAEVALLGWSYISGALLILVPVAILFITERSFSRYGLTLENWRVGLGVGMKCYLIRIVPLGALFLMNRLGYMYTELVASVVISMGEAVAVYLFLKWIGEKPLGGKGNHRVDLTVMVGLLALPIAVGYMMNRLSLQVASTVAWQFLFSGFGEEIRYRGYYQSRVNEEFGRPWTLMGVAFGPGLLVSSALFALSHALNTFNPFQGRFELAWGWALFTFFGGLFFGLIREKTGSIIAPGIAHGLPDAVGEALAEMIGMW
jgi:membrane protease YdiL (CAAX protease family)